MYESFGNGIAGYMSGSSGEVVGKCWTLLNILPCCKKWWKLNFCDCCAMCIFLIFFLSFKRGRLPDKSSFAMTPDCIIKSVKAVDYKCIISVSLTKRRVG